MIVNPRKGMTVQVWYNKRVAPTMPLHGKIGTVTIVSRGKPRNHGVTIDGQMWLCPAEIFECRPPCKLSPVAAAAHCALSSSNHRTIVPNRSYDPIAPPKAGRWHNIKKDKRTMGMKPYSYVVAGIKTTREQCKTSGIDLYEQFEENEHDIQAIYGEGTDDVLIGKVLFEADPYDDTDHAIELPLQPFSEVGLLLALSGIDAELKDIKLYAITVWL